MVFNKQNITLHGLHVHDGARIFGRISLPLPHDERYGKTGNEKRATCFATLLQNELKGDVARFTTDVQIC